MSTTGTTPACAPTQDVAAVASVSRFADYMELTKPRIALMGLITVTIGYTLGSAGEWQLGRLLHALFGIALVAAACSAINQCLEHRTDLLMTRTRNRPIPAGRLLLMEAWIFGLFTAAVGLAYLVLMVNLLTATLSLITMLLYTTVYTPLKRHTSFCTTIGAVPGALPPVLGWTAATGTLSLEAGILFAILFLWQFPHFLAIAWMYRQQYAQAGLRMLPARQPVARITGFLAVVYALALLPVSLLPAQYGLAGPLYFLVALLLGVAYLGFSCRFLWQGTNTSARGLLYYSLIYLPVLLMVLTWDHLMMIHY